MNNIHGNLALKLNNLKLNNLKLNNLKLNQLSPAQQIRKIDPTMTKTLRDQYSAAMYIRFRNLKGIINRTIIDNDVFSLKQPRHKSPGQLLAAAAMPALEFTGTTRAEQIEAFKDWLQQAIDEGILELTDARGNTITTAERWQNAYVRSAYEKGIYRAQTALKAVGVAGAKTVILPTQRVSQMFYAPIHAETVQELFLRNFNELKGITDVMSQQIMRELADGLAKGYNPRKIAKLINDRVNKIGITRARMLARTEVVRAFNEAALNQYEMAGITEVEPEVEWSYAHDACSICIELAQAGPYKISEARGMIPAHPRCRCCWIPIVSTMVA